MDLSLKNKKLALFFTYGVSLELWEKMGMLERELKLYKELGKCFEKIYFITYGKNDGRFQEQLAPYHIVVLPKKYPIFSAKGRSALGGNICYSFLIPFFYKKELQSCDFFKTNQMMGSWSAVVAKWLWRKKLIVRTGYTLSLNAKEKSFGRFVCARVIEWFAYRVADKIAVATDEEKEYLKKWQDKITVIPNYVDTDAFHPMPKIGGTFGKNILFVGRLAKEKNIESLLRAAQGFPSITLTIVGMGEEEAFLRRLAAELGLCATFVGRVPHRELPSLMNEADIVVLPSIYEGNPKVVIEAMAAGRPILATNVRGIRSVIRHDETGYLTDTAPASIRKGLEVLLADPVLCDRLGKNARIVAEENYSIPTIIQKELLAYRSLI